jgi:F-type H+-transporting ATPase subunit epsilon
MAKAFQVNMITPEKTAFEQTAVSIILPGSEGYLGAWANHAPLVTGVRPGVVWLKLDDAGTERYFAVGAGFCEISNNTVNLMVDSAEAATEIDLQAAEAELDRLKARLKASDPAEDEAALRDEAACAEAKVRAARSTHKR